MLVAPDRCAAQAEEVADFLLHEALARHGKRALQGRRARPFSTCRGGQSLATIASQRIKAIPELPLAALCSWSLGGPGVLLRSVPSPLELLTMQAHGVRCVSLVGPDAAIAPHASPLDFAVHDLCHLGHYLDNRYYDEQVGCFDALLALHRDATWQAIQASFDSTWQARRDYIAADTNGSAIYILAMLKLHLRAAIDRSLPGQKSVQDELWREVHERIGMYVADDQPEVRRAFLSVLGRGDAAPQAELVRQHLAARGRTIVQRQSELLEWRLRPTF